MKDFHHFISHWQNLLALFLVGFFVFVAAAAPVLAPPDSKDQPVHIKVVGRVIDHIPHPPGNGSPLGTLPGQQDVYQALVWGTRSALNFGLTVALITAGFGILIGAASAYTGGLFNNLSMRITDAFLSFPVIAGVVLFRQLLVIAMEASGMQMYFGGDSEITGTPIPLYIFLSTVNPVMIAFILFSWMPQARIVNSIVMQVKQSEYILAARAMGASHMRIILRHLIPNSISPAIVLAARDVGGIVLLQATFTFIGLGGGSIWGNLLVKGRDWIIGPGGNPFTHWWVFLPATLALILFGIGWNLLGDGLNDWLNPRNR